MIITVDWLLFLDGGDSLSILLLGNRLKKFIEHYHPAILRILTLVGKSDDLVLKHPLYLLGGIGAATLAILPDIEILRHFLAA